MGLYLLYTGKHRPVCALSLWNTSPWHTLVWLKALGTDRGMWESMILSVYSRVRGMFHSSEQWRLLDKNKKQVFEGRTVEIGLIIYNYQLLIL